MGKSTQWDEEAYDDDFEDDEVEEQPKKKNPIRDQLKKLERENKTLKEQVASQRTSRVEEVLKAKGVSAKYAKHYPAGREVSEESILAYLSDEFDITPNAGSGDGQGDQETSDEDLAALRKIHNAQQGSTDSGAPSVDQQIADLRNEAFKENWSTEQFVEEMNKLFK